MILSTFFVLGFTVVFILLGLGAGAIVILLGLFMTGVLRLPWLQRTVQLSPNWQGGSPLAATTFGFAFAIGWTPCIGPILGAILMATSSVASVQAGMVYLSAYSLGLALPFLASTLLINRFAQHRQRLGRWSAYLRPIAGIIVIVMGVAIITDSLTRLSSALQTWFPFLLNWG